MDAEMSAAWGMCCEEGSDSKEGMEAVDDVDKLRGVMDSKEDGFDESSFDLESYNRLSEDGMDSRLSESIDEILMGFDEAGFDAEGIAIITLSPPLSSKCSFLCVPSTVRFVNVAFVFSITEQGKARKKELTGF